MATRARSTLLAALVTILGISEAAAAGPAAGAAEPAAVLSRCVVKIMVTCQEPDYRQPWQLLPADKSMGSGCVIEGNRILTNAHVVADATYVQVQRAGDVRLFPAQVAFAAHDCDLALLTVRDHAFFEGTTPLALGELPDLRDHVAVCGYPEGGYKLSVTEGVVSRIEVQEYAHSGRELLVVQIDAAINPGNSGGPVLREDRLVGVAFQYDATGESLGYIIPVPIIRRFLDDVRDGRYDGVPWLGLAYQPLDNPCQRRTLRVPPEVSGVYLTRVVHGSSSSGALRPGDVLTELGGQPVGGDGTIPFGSDDRIALGHVLAARQVGDRLSARLLRDGAALAVELTLRPFVGLVPPEQFDVRATYFVYAGLVFVPLTRDYLNTWDPIADAPLALRRFVDLEFPGPGRAEVVVLSHVLEHEVNRGYHDLENLVITEANGRPVGSVAELKRALEGTAGPVATLRADDGSRLDLDVAEAKRAGPEILEAYGIRRAASLDLR